MTRMMSSSGEKIVSKTGNEERAISLWLNGCPTNLRLARNRFRSGISIRPMHLFGHNRDQDYYFRLLWEEERDSQSACSYNDHLMIIVRLLSTRASWVGLAPPSLLGSREPALLWNQLHQLSFFRRKQEAAQESYSSCRSVGSDCKIARGCYFSKTFDARQFSIFFFSAAIWTISLLMPFRLTRVVKSSVLNGY